jgi:hypothetical protein
MIGLTCKADEFAAKMLTLIAGIRSRGIVTLAGIVEELTRQKWPTAWSMTAVSNRRVAKAQKQPRDR